MFDLKPAAAPLQKPLLRLTDAAFTPTPGPSGVNHDGQTWNSTDKLEFLWTFAKPTEVACLRLVGPTTSAVGRFGANGRFYEAGDVKFSLVLSDDNFQKDVRKIDSPQVTFEETPRMVAGHFIMTRYPTWRVEVAAKARQIKLLPRATARQRENLVLTDLEVYGAQRVDQLHAKVFACDINGDGSNELVVGTSEKELAAYDADGRRLWQKTFPGEIHTRDVADLDEDGKAEVLAYLTTEKLHRINGDATERPVGDVNTVWTAGVNIFSIGAWGPDDPKKKEAVLWSGPSFRVLDDGSVRRLQDRGIQASLRLANLYPNEPEAMAVLSSYEFSILSAKRDAEGNYITLGTKDVTGSNSGNEASPPGVLRQFCRILTVDHRGTKWLVGAVASGLNCYPIAAFAKNAKETGWKFNTGGPCATAVLAEDFSGDGVPEVLLARQDGFVNIFKLADGASVGRLSTGEPILGMAVLQGKDGNPCLAVGTRFSVQLFARDPSGTGLTRVGKTVLPAPAAAFAGPGGANRDGVFVVDSAGQVSVLVLK
jgi:hypothetical protein